MQAFDLLKADFEAHGLTIQQHEGRYFVTEIGKNIELNNRFISVPSDEEFEGLRVLGYWLWGYESGLKKATRT